MIKPANIVVVSALLCSPVIASEVCTGFGPQTPRDIDSLVGINQQVIPTAPNPEQMNLCNIHFHQNAEHKAKAFSIAAGSGKHVGYQCGINKTLTAQELKPVQGDVCNGLQPGDTIEVHWVHSSCSVTPGPGLGSCMVNNVCINPSLRVEAQVFTLVNDPLAADFNDYAYNNEKLSGYHQAKALPNNTGEPATFAGSTTGPSFSEQSCSPLGVTWSVRPQCQKLNIQSLAKWCKSNVFDESYAHGVRKLVTDKRLLSPIK